MTDQPDAEFLDAVLEAFRKQCVNKVNNGHGFEVTKAAILARLTEARGNALDPKQLKNGLYKLYWGDGGASEASVGRNAAGDVWYAPTNWITVPSYDWSKIISVAALRKDGRTS